MIGNGRVQVAADDRTVLAAWPDAPAGFTPDPRTPLMGGRLYGDAPPDADADEVDYHAHRLSVGVPDPAADAPQDTTYPIEADFDLLNGIDFHKGCFVGQETTSRMKRRGVIKNRMMPLDLDGPLPAFGAEVLKGWVNIKLRRWDEADRIFRNQDKKRSTRDTRFGIGAVANSKYGMWPENQNNCKVRFKC